jgi:hypothetical protein
MLFNGSISAGLPSTPTQAEIGPGFQPVSLDSTESAHDLAQLSPRQA